MELEKDLIDMTDEEKIIENNDDLEDKLNSTLDEKEQEEQKLKQTIFNFLLETENELRNSFKEDNTNNEVPSTSNKNIYNDSKYDSDENFNEEELLGKIKNQLRNKISS